MFDVTALGELLIDFTPAGLSDKGSDLLEKNPGGAPANVLAAVSKLKGSTAFIGMVGNDQFGFFLRDVLKSNDIDVSGLRFSNVANTTLAFVHLDRDGDRSFSFYRNPGADMMLDKSDIDYEIIKKSKIFHFGSISLTNEPSRSATISAAKFAKENSIIVSYDPNYRPPLWESPEDAKEKIMLGLKYADILKMSKEELELMTGTDSLEEGSDILYRMGISIVLVTLGPHGCFYRYGGGYGQVRTYDVKVVDTTGAGDAFLGGFLYRLNGRSLQDISKLKKEELEDIVSFGNAVGAISTTKKGAIPAMPTLEEIKLCLSNISRL